MAEGNGQNGSARWAGVVVTVVLAAGAMTIQWGVVTTKLQQVEKRLDEFIADGVSTRPSVYAKSSPCTLSLFGILRRPVLVFSGRFVYSGRDGQSGRSLIHKE